MPDWQQLVTALKEAGIAAGPDSTPRAVGGGDISDAWRLEASNGPLFLKTGPAESAAMFSGEAEGLEEIDASGTVRVPRVLGHGADGPVAWLALEWLDIVPADAAVQRDLGKRLAAMHRVTADAHGWHRDNTIGSTPQVNTRSTSWAEFWGQHRLGYQLELAARYGYGGRLQDLGAQLIAGLDGFFAGHEPARSLLHGDLWGGNQAAAANEPVVFDPAVYYGDRETDLAMTKLFGGFSGAFYEEYERAWPLPPGHERRVAMYQLYHVLNHLNLFGRGYLARAEQLMASILEAG
jgi:protein-ribulosamine 3-kinase